MESLQHRVADPNTLYEAWNLTRSRFDDDDPRGWPAEGLDIERHLADRIEELAESLACNDWAPRPAHRVLLEKTGGGTRELHVPPVSDRIVERAFGLVLQPLIDPALSPWSYAYRRGLGVSDALADLAWLRDQNFRFVVRSDFKDCFDDIDHAPLLKRLAEEIDDEWTLTMVDSLLTRPVQGRGGTVEGVAQGGPISPMLTNLYLDRFDEAMVAAGIPIIRYADDFVLFTRTRSAAETAVVTARATAEEVGMHLNEDKTHVTSFKEGFAFLGEEIGPVHPVRELAAVTEGDLIRKALYVTLEGASVRVARGQVIVNDGDEELLRAPKSLISHMVLRGPVGLSAGARSMALYEQVPVTFLSRRGSFLGRLDGAEPGRAKLRRLQYRAGDDRARRRELARGFVLGKIANQRTLVQRFTRRSAIPVLLGAVKSLQESRRAALVATSMNQLRGVEGSAAKVYFGALTELFPDDARFTGRNRRPPKDPANAALGYAYAILLGEACSALQTVGLDPVAGYLHEDFEKRPALGLDLMEEFRPLIVDQVVLELFRRKRLKANRDFRRDRGAVLLAENGRRTLTAAFEDRMLTIFSHVPSGKRMTYRRAITMQAQQIVAVLEGRSPNYEPVPWR